jgi:hypothetical protein
MSQDLSLASMWHGLCRATGAVCSLSQMLVGGSSCDMPVQGMPGCLCASELPAAAVHGGWGLRATQATFFLLHGNGGGLLQTPAASGVFACMLPVQRGQRVGDAGTCLLVQHASRLVTVQAPLVHVAARCHVCSGRQDWQIRHRHAEVQH